MTRSGSIPTCRGNPQDVEFYLLEGQVYPHV